MFKEFRQFVARGNVVDLAVAVIMGTAFGAIVNSMVTDILMPPVGLILGKVDFSNLFLNLSRTGQATLKDAKAAGAVTVNYGLFLNTVINFLIVSFFIFIVVKEVNKFKPAPETPPAGPVTKDCPLCLSQIPLKAKRCAHCCADIPA